MGGGGSGGSSGKVDYPEYMKKVHADWLNASASDGSGGNSLETDMTTVMNAALGASPFTTATAYDPEVYIAGMEAALTTYNSRYLDVIADMNYADIMDLIKVETADIGGPTEAEILASVAAFSNSLDEEMETVHIPRFRRGMQDINAVQSSSFVLGQAMIEEEGLRKKAQYEADIRLNAALERSKTQAGLLSPSMQLFSDMLKTRLSYAESLAKLDIEHDRMAIVAYKEQTDKDLEIDEKHANWDLDVFHYGGNLLAAIGGGTAASSSKPSQAQSAIGGALSGAAAGASVGSFAGPYGTAIGAGVGAVVGGLAGVFS